ncbi:MAG: hypothetical protein ABIK86_01700, partial [candidate division WOR-3 bacterium]
PGYLWDKVQPLVEAALLAAFSFEQRRFGQPVTLSEVVTVIQNVPGVDAVLVTRLEKDGMDGRKEPLPAALPEEDAGADAKGAELLTIDAGTLKLTEMVEVTL